MLGSDLTARRRVFAVECADNSGVSSQIEEMQIMPRPHSSAAGKENQRATSRIARKDTVNKFDERVVGATDRTVPVGPVKQSRKAREPMPEPALDHRKQIVGTDRPRRRR
jgi:hypothetical protein